MPKSLTLLVMPTRVVLRFQSQFPLGLQQLLPQRILPSFSRSHVLPGQLELSLRQVSLLNKVRLQSPHPHCLHRNLLSFPHSQSIMVLCLSADPQTSRLRSRTLFRFPALMMDKVLFQARTCFPRKSRLAQLLLSQPLTPKMSSFCRRNSNHNCMYNPSKKRLRT